MRLTIDHIMDRGWDSKTHLNNYFPPNTTFEKGNLFLIIRDGYYTFVLKDICKHGAALHSSNSIIHSSKIETLEDFETVVRLLEASEVSLFGSKEWMEEQKKETEKQSYDPKPLTELGFLFRGNDNRTYWCRILHGVPWFLYYTPQGWVQLKSVVTLDIVQAYKQRLSPEIEDTFHRTDPNETWFQLKESLENNKKTS